MVVEEEEEEDDSFIEISFKGANAHPPKTPILPFVPMCLFERTENEKLLLLLLFFVI